MIEPLVKTSLVKDCFEEGGSIHPLLIDSSITKGLSLCNTSILETEKDSKYLLNIRWVSYYLHHNENHQKFQTPWGPLNYVRPDEDQHLRTENYICDLDLERFNNDSVKYTTLQRSILVEFFSNTFSL